LLFVVNSAKAQVRVLEFTGFAGALYLPRNAEKPPVVITLGGSEGGDQSARRSAAELAKHGLAALALPYFRAPGLPRNLENIPLEYFGKAIRFIHTRSEVASDKIAVLGVSRGGELALLLASVFPEIRAVVALVPSPIRWGGMSPRRGAPAWTYEGEPLPFLVNTRHLSRVQLPDGRIAYSGRRSFEEALVDKTAVETAMSKIERTRGPILMIGGDEDQVWPSCTFIKLAEEYLREKHHPFKDRSICYPKAGHRVAAVPGSPGAGILSFRHPVSHRLSFMGGTADGDTLGQQDAWAQIEGFLHEVFPSRG
jgi:dienelactone hydrolase